MKKQLSIIALLAAATLWACGGGTTQNTNVGDNQSADTTTKADTVAAAPAAGETLSNKQIWDWFAKEGNDLMLTDYEYERSQTPDGANVDWSGTELSNYFAYKCFPLKSGGIKVYQTAADFFWHGDGEDRFEFNAYVVQNGALVKTPLEPELQQVIDAMTPGSSPDDQRNLFWDNGIFFPKIDILFAWDGEKMVKTKAKTVSIAYEVVEKMVDNKLVPFKKDALECIGQKYIAENINRISVHPGDGSMYLHCFPMNGGGYYVPVVWNEVCDCPVAYRYEYYTYKDGNLTKAKSLIPKPTINDFYANADQLPANVSAILKQRIADNTYYYFAKDSAICVSFEGIEWDGEYVVPEPLKKFFDSKRNNFPHINYIWDGGKFIRDPEDKPYEEDLSLFGAENGTANADVDNYPSVEFWLMKNFKDFAAPEVAERKKSMDISPMISTESFSGDENSSGLFIYACYPFKDKKDEYLAICYQESDNRIGLDVFKLVSGVSLEEYEDNPFDANYITKRTKNYAEEHQYEVYIKLFQSDGLTIAHGGEEVIGFKWNGEKFIEK